MFVPSKIDKPYTLNTLHIKHGQNISLKPPQDNKFIIRMLIQFMMYDMDVENERQGGFPRQSSPHGVSQSI